MKITIRMHATPEDMLFALEEFQKKHKIHNMFFVETRGYLVAYIMYTIPIYIIMIDYIKSFIYNSK